MPLELEREYYNEIRESLGGTDTSHVAVIHGRKLIGIYPTLEEAYSETAKNLGLVPVLIKKIGEQEQPVSAPALSLGILSAHHPSPISR